MRTCAEQRPNLVAYNDRLMARYFPAFAPKTAISA